MKRLFWIFAVIAMICCGYVHRNVFKALITGEPMPKAPSWHFWVSKENRRD
ncbi:MAG: hypothetical protein IKE16_07110 [Solobacterium sp.]|nr:hypothetical protein [Solobacterium sp.]MBR2794403.1 hypothetical protein [Solobacterium sp.]